METERNKRSMHDECDVEQGTRNKRIKYSMDKMQILTFEDTYTRKIENEMVLFGRTETGAPREVHVVNVPHTICVAIGDDFEDHQELAAKLNTYLIKRLPYCKRYGCVNCRNGGGENANFGVSREPCMQNCKYLTEAVVGHRVIRMRGYDMEETHDRSFLEFTLNRSFFLRSASKFLETAEVGSVNALNRGVYGLCKSGVESFILSKEVTSFDWVEVPTGETVVDYQDLRPIAFPGVNAPFKMIHFDIETISKKYNDRESDRAQYPVGMISTTVNGTVNKTFVVKVNGVVDIPDPEVEFFVREVDMLLAFRDYIIAQDIDFFVGYNSNRFDMPYLMKRAEKLGARQFKYFSRIPSEPVIFNTTSTHSNQKGSRKVTTINCPGRVFMDLYPIIEALFKFRSYKLEAVAKEFDLPVSKDDLHYSYFDEYFHGTPEQRALFIKYCKKDVYVTVLLSRKLDLLPKISARCRILRTEVTMALDRGLSCILSMMVRAEMKGQHMMNSTKGIDKGLRESFKSIKGYAPLLQLKIKTGKYPGAHVFDPKTGYYKCCIVTYDFNSLYPNLIRSHNIDATTQVADPEGRTDITVTPNGFGFLKPDVKIGVLPRLMTRLINARAEVREKMERESDVSRHAMMDAEQNELKVAANSFYGLLGAPTSDLLLISGAASVTSLGAKLINKVCDALNESPDFHTKYPEYEKTHGHKLVFGGFVEKYGVDVIYGDTDSLFVAFRKVADVEYCSKVAAKEVHEWINKTSKLLYGTLKMGLENISNPFLLLAKKKYVKVVPDPKRPGTFNLKKSGLGKRNMTRYNANFLQRVLEMSMIEGCTVEQLVYSVTRDALFRRRVYQLVQEYSQDQIDEAKKTDDKFDARVTALPMFEQADAEKVVYAVSHDKEFWKVLSKKGLLDIANRQAIERAITAAAAELWSGRLFELSADELKYLDGESEKDYEKRISGLRKERMEVLKHTTKLNKPLADYPVTETDSHVVAARQMVSAGLHVEEGDRVEHFFCNIPETTLKRKSDRVVAAELMGTHTLHYESYVEEMFKSLSCVILHMLTGKNTKEQKATLKRLLYNCDKRTNVIQSAPDRGETGVMDSLVKRVKRDVTVVSAPIKLTSTFTPMTRTTMDQFIDTHSVPRMDEEEDDDVGAASAQKGHTNVFTEIENAAKTSRALKQTTLSSFRVSKFVT